MKKLLFALLITLLPASMFGATYTVTNLDDAGPGSLRQAIIDANGNGGADIINFNVTGIIELSTGEMSITGAVTINGPGIDDLTIDANYDSRAFSIGTGVTVEINNMTIMNGREYDMGGAILNSGNLTLSFVYFDYCGLGGPFNPSTSNYIGGAILNESSLTVNNCTFDACYIAQNGDYEAAGGAIYNQGTLEVNNTLFDYCDITQIGDETAFGGGIFNNSDGTTSINNSTFDGCYVGQSYDQASGGGAVFNQGSLSITNSTFVGNSVYLFCWTNNSFNPLGVDVFGGAIYNHSGSINIFNSTFSENYVAGEGNSSNASDNWGGAIFSGNSSGDKICDCTFWSNWAICYDENYDYIGNSNFGGAIYSIVPTGNGAFGPIIKNNIFDANVVNEGTTEIFEDLYNNFQSHGYNIITGRTTNASFSPNTDNDILNATSAQVDLQDLADNGGPTWTHAITQTSVAWNAGSVTDIDGNTVTADQRGEGIYGVNDIGAYEVAGTPDQQVVPILPPWAMAAFLVLLVVFGSWFIIRRF